MLLLLNHHESNGAETAILNDLLWSFLFCFFESESIQRSLWSFAYDCLLGSYLQCHCAVTPVFWQVSNILMLCRLRLFNRQMRERATSKKLDVTFWFELMTRAGGRERFLKQHL